MITLKNAEQIAKMREAGHLLNEVLMEVCKAVEPGVTTKHLDHIAERLIRQAGARPSFLGYEGYPASLCTSVDDVVVHGFPDDKPLKEGSIVGLDIGLALNGWQSDMARTVCVGNVDEETRRLVEVTKQSFFEGLRVCKPGYRLGDIGSTIQRYAEGQGFSVVRALCGHGIGREMHEDPEVPNYGVPGHGVRLRPGMTIAIEPMINAGDYEVSIDGWHVATEDGSRSAHYENTVLITAGEPEILSMRGMRDAE